MSLVELVLLLLCFPVSWGFGWAMAMRWSKIRWMIELEQVMAQTKELKKTMSLLENLMEKMEQEK